VIIQARAAIDLEESQAMTPELPDQVASSTKRMGMLSAALGSQLPGSHSSLDSHRPDFRPSCC
jgi:hypothetical protein